MPDTLRQPVRVLGAEIFIEDQENEGLKDRRECSDKGRRRRPRNSGRHNERFHASPRRGVAPPLELLIKHTN